ncbi:MAG: hypothetical protein WA857_21455 [Candidatus Acidiferrum sp.]
MHIATLVTDVLKIVEVLRDRRGDLVLAMLYNSTEGATSSWNLIISAPWADKLGVVEATRAITHELSLGLSLENRSAISRVTVLKTIDPFVRDMTGLFQVSDPTTRLPISNVAPDGIPVGSGYVFYSQPTLLAQIPT